MTTKEKETLLDLVAAWRRGAVALHDVADEAESNGEDATASHFYASARAQSASELEKLLDYLDSTQQTEQQ